VADAWWLPKVDPDDATVAAAYIRREFPESRLCFYGSNLSVPLCFDLRQSIPLYRTPEALAVARQKWPDLVVINVTKPERAPPEPPGMTPVGERVVADEAVYRFFRASPAAATAPSPTTRPATSSDRP
jgi:hypothetical protein